MGVNLKLDGRLVKVSSTGFAAGFLVSSITILPILLSSKFKITLKKNSHYKINKSTLLIILKPWKIGYISPEEAITIPFLVMAKSSAPFPAVTSAFSHFNPWINEWLSSEGMFFL